MEPFAFGQGDHGGAGGLKRGLVEADQACVAQEGFDAQGTTESGGAAGGEGVVGPGQVIPYGLWSPGPKKDGPGVADVFGQGFGMFHQQLKVLGGEAVTEAGRSFKVCADHDQAPIFQG